MASGLKRKMPPKDDQSACCGILHRIQQETVPVEVPGASGDALCFSRVTLPGFQDQPHGGNLWAHWAAVS